MALERWRPTGSLMRRNPFGAIERQMEDMFDRAFRGWPARRLESDSAGWVYNYETGYIAANTPGEDMQGVRYDSY